VKFAIYTSVILLGVAGLMDSGPAMAGAPMATGGPVVPPAGFIAFCARHLQDCIGKSSGSAPVEMTPERRRALDAVQAQVNAAIAPREDPKHVWDYPTDGTGDCNKFALAKRRELLAQGWPRESLLLATAITERGEGHLVLVVRSDSGDLVLDNRVTAVVDWTRLPYRWVSVQTAQNPARWVSILSTPVATADATAALGASPRQAH